MPLISISSVLTVALMSTSCSRAVKPDAIEGASGKVDRNLILPVDSMRMQLEQNQVVIPGELTNPEVMPLYPESLLASGLPDHTVCVSFVVNENGSVAGAAPVYGVDGCPRGDQQSRKEFLDATLAAVSRWDFFSYVRCTFPPGTLDAQKCNGPGSVSEQVAVTLAYSFLFSSQHGSGTVQRVK